MLHACLLAGGSGPERVVVVISGIEFYLTLVVHLSAVYHHGQGKRAVHRRQGPHH